MPEESRPPLSNRGNRRAAAHPATDRVEEQFAKMLGVLIIIAVAGLSHGIDIPITPSTNARRP